MVEKVRQMTGKPPTNKSWDKSTAYQCLLKGIGYTYQFVFKYIFICFYKKGQWVLRRPVRGALLTSRPLQLYRLRTSAVTKPHIRFDLFVINN